LAAPVALLTVLGLALTSIPAAAADLPGAGSATEVPTTSDRYGTAAQAAFEAFPGGASVAVLASGETFADALAAAPLAAFYDAPILLTRQSTLPPSTAGALEALGVADVIVMGGPGAVGFDVSNGLELEYQVSRVAGPDRYATAAQAALDAFPGGADLALLASGETFADALAAAPLAAFYDAPILLTRQGATPAATLAALRTLGVADIVVMGGPGAIGFDQTNRLELDYQVSRVAGDDRYGTAAQAALDAFPAGADFAVLASGETFPDALAAAPLAAAFDAPILLTRNAGIPAATSAALDSLGIAQVLVMGGSGAISTAVTDELALRYGVRRIAGGSETTREVEVFFSNVTLGDPCGEVFPVRRTVPLVSALESSLEDLLEGPTAAERAQGYSSWFSSETDGMLRNASVDYGVALVDFDDLRSVIPNASTSCGSAALVSSLDRTTLQFPPIVEVEYSLEGDRGAFYEWLQLVEPGS